MGYALLIMAITERVLSAPEQTKPATDNRATRGPLRRAWDRLTPTGRVTTGLVLVGIGYGAVRTGAFDIAAKAIADNIPGINHGGNDISQSDLGRCFTVPGTEAKPLDVCEVKK